MIHLAGVTKTFGATRALDAFDLTVPPAQTTVLLGPSGCGKSTVLRLVIGLIPPDAGTVTLDGTPVRPETIRALRHRMGYVIQEGGLFPHLTAFDNVALLVRHLGWDTDRITARMDELADLVQLPPERLASFPTQLSGGQRQRVALMRALMPDPDVLLLDEPLGALDPMIRADLQRDLRHIFQSLRKTVLLVTHDISEAGFLGDRIVLLRQGRTVQEGTLADLVRHPADAFVEAFISAQRSPLESLAAEADDG